jgi:hypothetical protein
VIASQFPLWMSASTSLRNPLWGLLTGAWRWVLHELRQRLRIDLPTPTTGPVSSPMRRSRQTWVAKSTPSAAGRPGWSASSSIAWTKLVGAKSPTLPSARVATLASLNRSWIAC